MLAPGEPAKQVAIKRVPSVTFASCATPAAGWSLTHCRSWRMTAAWRRASALPASPSSTTKLDVHVQRLVVV